VGRGPEGGRVKEKSVNHMGESGALGAGRRYVIFKKKGIKKSDRQGAGSDNGPDQVKLRTTEKGK